MNEGGFGSCASCPNTIRHERGHCLGLWHEFNRTDADRWLWEEPDLDGARFEAVFNNTAERAALMPMLGNYDYDSLMHYSQLPGDNPPTCMGPARYVRRAILTTASSQRRMAIWDRLS